MKDTVENIYSKIFRPNAACAEDRIQNSEYETCF